MGPDHVTIACFRTFSLLTICMCLRFKSLVAYYESCRYCLEPPQASVVTLALAFVTLTPNCFAFATMSTLFLDETACEILEKWSVCHFALWNGYRKVEAEGHSSTYSAAKVLLCIKRRSTSDGLWTRKALWPEGIKWRVFLFEP